MAIKKYKITNISRGNGKPGVMLDLGTSNQGTPKNIIHPGSFSIIDESEMSDSYFGWQRNGYAKIEVIGENIFEELNKTLPSVHAKATDLVVDESMDIDDDIDMEEPDMAMAVDATIPNEGIITKQASATNMGQEPKSLGKGPVDATNPLLDETPKELDNSNGKFVAKAAGPLPLKPLQQQASKKAQGGRTIAP
jgi:hypothetical protein